MVDIYESQSPTMAAPASGAFAIVPHDMDALPMVTRAVYAGVGGTLRVEMLWGGVVTFANLPDGALLPIRVQKVLADSTATSIVGLY